MNDSIHMKFYKVQTYIYSDRKQNSGFPWMRVEAGMDYNGVQGKFEDKGIAYGDGFMGVYTC